MADKIIFKISNSTAHKTFQEMKAKKKKWCQVPLLKKRYIATGPNESKRMTIIMPVPHHPKFRSSIGHGAFYFTPNWGCLSSVGPNMPQP